MKKMLERIQELRGKMEALGKKLDLSDEEVVESESMIKEKRSLTARVAMLQSCDDSDDDDSDGDSDTTDQEQRSGGEPPAGSKFEVGDNLKLKRGFETLGHQMIAVRNAAVAGNQGRSDLDDVLKYQMRAAEGGNISVPSEGGFGVQTEFVTELIALTEGQAQLAPLCRTLPLGKANAAQLTLVDEKSRVTGSRFGGVQVYRVNEATALTKTMPKMKKIRLELKKLAALYYTTAEELEDGRTLTSMALLALPEEMAHVLDDEIYFGDGVDGARGILGHPATVEVDKVSSQAADTVVSRNLFDMRARMPYRNRKNMVWLINQDVEPSLQSIDWGNSVNAWWPAGSKGNNNPFDTLFGRPVYPIEQASTVGDLGDIALVDFTQYLLIKKAGLRTDTSMHVQFLTDQMAFRFIERSNGMPIWLQALTPQKGSNKLSPVVMLKVRS